MYGRAAAARHRASRALSCGVLSLYRLRRPSAPARRAIAGGAMAGAHKTGSPRRSSRLRGVADPIRRRSHRRRRWHARMAERVVRVTRLCVPGLGQLRKLPNGTEVCTHGVRRRGRGIVSTSARYNTGRVGREPRGRSSRRQLVPVVNGCSCALSFGTRTGAVASCCFVRANALPPAATRAGPAQALCHGTP